MQEFPLTGPKREPALKSLKKSPLFGALTPSDLDVVLAHCRWLEFEPSEVIVREGDPADSFFLMVSGDAEITVSHTTLDDQVEVGSITPVNIFGEMALLLNHPRTATVVAREATAVLQFGKQAFDMMIDGIKGYARQLSTSLAERLVQTSRRVPLPQLEREDLDHIDPETLRALPSQFLFRHRVMPITLEENVLRLGFVDDPTPQVVNAVRRMLPNIQIRPFRISTDVFNDVLRAYGFVDLHSTASMANIPAASQANLPAASQANLPAASQANLPAAEGISVQESHAPALSITPQEAEERLAKLKPLLQRMVAEGASDLHMSAGQQPRWRINGDLYVIEDCRPLAHNEAEQLFAGIVPPSARRELIENMQADFSYGLPEVGRFRVNLFYDEKGSSAVLRHIPSVIPTPQQLQLPPIMKKMTEMNQGLILVTGPTGSGKSTTLAALIEEINRSQPKHIITLEDPIEFTYESKKSLVNQRQVGASAKSFSLGLRGALREDPDIVLVGELRDMETMMLAIETANTGHLVFGTLHTRGALSTIERIIDMFPAELQSQVRSSVSELLKCVISQVLCKRKGGGRVAAFELLTINAAASNLIRQSKTHQLNTILTTQKPNKSLNDHMEELIKRGTLDFKEALNHTYDKDELAQRFGRQPISSSPGFSVPQAVDGKPRIKSKTQGMQRFGGK